MSGVNKCFLIGRVGKEPEVRTLESGNMVATFSVATSEKYKNKAGEMVETTEWHNIVAWKGLADVVSKYVKKGSNLFIEGKITTRSYEKDGVKKYTTEIMALSIQLLDGKPKPESGHEGEISQGDAEGKGLDGEQIAPTGDMPF